MSPRCDHCPYPLFQDRTLGHPGIYDIVREDGSRGCRPFEEKTVFCCSHCHGVSILPTNMVRTCPAFEPNYKIGYYWQDISAPTYPSVSFPNGLTEDGVRAYSEDFFERPLTAEELEMRKPPNLRNPGHMRQSRSVFDQASTRTAVYDRNNLPNHTDQQWNTNNYSDYGTSRRQ